MTETKLKPCPFCGARPFIFCESGIGFSTHVKKVLYEVECTECFAKIDSWFDSEQEATEAWNKRAELPSSQPEQRWIPCSKRLPPELKPVNVTWINRQPPTYYENLKDKPFTDTAVIYKGKWYWQSAVCVDLLKEYGESPADDVEDAIDIVAWMPLPEPYEEVNRMNDFISRQAAIKAVNTALFPKINTAKDAEKALRDLPSAQQEIVRCCKCGFWDRDTLRHQFNDFREWNEAECKILAERDPYNEINRYTEADDFCSYAERRTDE